MKVFLPVVSFVVFVFAGLATCSAQTVALLDAPLPVSSSVVEPGAPVSAPMGAFALSAPEPVQKPPRLHVLDWSMIGAASTLRILDFTSTEKAMDYPQYLHESILPNGLVHNKAAFAAFQASTVGVDVSAYKLLVRHNLRPLAQLSQYMYVGVMTFQVARNYQLLGKVPAQPAE